jgi:hypothetical protein
MSWGTRYIVQWQDAPPFYTEWNIRFKLEDYVGVIEYIKGAGISPARLNYESNDEDTHSPIKASFLEMDLMEFTEDKYLELFEYDRKAMVEVTRKPEGENETIFWMGWTKAGEYETLYNLPPKPITVTAVCGLTFLNSMELTLDETGATGISSPGPYALYKYFRQAFNKIGLDLTIYESFDIYAYGTAKVLSPLYEHYLDTWAFYLGNGKYKSLYEILSFILFNPCVGGRLYQKNGHWYMDRTQQLITGEISYRTYDSTFGGTVLITTENLFKAITTQFGSPMNVPVDMTLTKKTIRPYTKLTIKTNYALNNNMVRYPEKPNTVIGPITYSLVTEDSNYVMLLSFRNINNAFYPVTQGIIYNLGYSNAWGALNTQPDSVNISKAFMTLNISGMFRGRMRIRLYIDDVVSGKRYFYTDELHINDKTIATGWYEEVTNAATGFGSIIYLENDTTNEVSFDEVVDINTFGANFSGQMYLQICPPWWATQGISRSPILKINTDSLSVTWNECKTSDNNYAIDLNTIQTNTKEYPSDIYTAPCMRQDYYDVPGVSRDHYFRYYLNPQLAYPGLLLYKSGALYIPCKWVYYDKSTVVDPVKLEIALAQDIMALHSMLRWQVTGRILGQFDIGTVFTYKGKTYMIASMIFDIHTAQTEVTLLQIGEYVEILGLESSGDILATESDQYIPL